MAPPTRIADRCCPSLHACMPSFEVGRAPTAGWIMTLPIADQPTRAPPLGLGPRGLLPNLYDIVIFILIAAAFVLLAHGAREMGAPLAQLEIGPVTLDP